MVLVAYRDSTLQNWIANRCTLVHPDPTGLAGASPELSDLRVPRVPPCRSLMQHFGRADVGLSSAHKQQTADLNCIFVRLALSPCTLTPAISTQ
jgi:hypothetical protein